MKHQEVIDAPTRLGPWAWMTPESYRLYGRYTKFGPGLGQRFVKQADGKFLKVEG